MFYHPAALVAKDIDVLIARGEQQLAEAQKLVADHRNNNRSHLLSSIEYEIRELQETLAQLKAEDRNATRRTHQINMYEEDLLRSENIIGEELDFVEEVYRNYQASNRTANEFVEYGERLIAEGKAEIAKHQGHQSRDVRAIGWAVSDIQAQVNRLRAHPPHGAYLSYTEQSLIQNEKTLRALLDRVRHSQSRY